MTASFRVQNRPQVKIKWPLFISDIIWPMAAFSEVRILLSNISINLPFNKALHITGLNNSFKKITASISINPKTCAKMSTTR